MAKGFLLTSLIALGALQGVLGHSRIWSLWLNGQDQGQGVAIRLPSSNYPVKDLKSSNMICNDRGTTEVSKWLSVHSGDKLTFEWYHNTRGDEIIASSHKGPVQVYIADASKTELHWVKLFSAGYIPGSSEWAIDQLIAARGKHSVVIPDIASGKYLLRAELLGLHEADSLYTQNPVRGIQNYNDCVQISITSSGTKTLPTDGIVFPGAYTDQTPGIKFNIYENGDDPKSYVAPGPGVWSGSLGGNIGA